MSKRIGSLALPLAAMFVATAARADYVPYTSFASFQAASKGLTTARPKSAPPAYVMPKSTGFTSPGGVSNSNASGGGFLATTSAGFHALPDATYGTIVVGDKSAHAGQGVSLSPSSGNVTSMGTYLNFQGSQKIVNVLVTTVKEGTISLSLAYRGSSMAFFGITTSAGDYITNLKFVGRQSSVPTSVHANALTGDAGGLVPFGEPVPEPASAAMLCLGLLAVGIPVARRKFRRAHA